MRKKIRLSEDDLRRIVRKVINESLTEESFEGRLRDKFYNDILDLCKGVIEDQGLNMDEYEGYAEEWAEMRSERWTEDAMDILRSGNWRVPEDNFRPLDFVMGEKGIRTFEDLLGHDDAVDIFCDWFWDAFGSFGVEYNFGSDLDEYVYDRERENGDGDDSESESGE